MAEEFPLPPCTRVRIAKPGRLHGRLGTIVGAGPLPGEPPIWYVQADPPEPNPTLRPGRIIPCFREEFTIVPIGVNPAKTTPQPAKKGSQ